MPYKVSIIVPVWNGEDYIENCLKSAFNQNFDSIEYLLYDNCPTDNTMHIARKVVNESNRVKDIRILGGEINTGAGFSRNICMKEAQGEYIFFLDSDDLLPENSIADLYKETNNGNADLVIGSFTSINYINKGDINPWSHTFNNQLIKGNFAPANYYFDKGIYVMPWNKLVKKSFIEKYAISFAEVGFHSDNFFTLQLLLQAQEMSTVNSNTYIYSIRKGSIMQTLGENSKIGYLQACKDYGNFSHQFLNTPIAAKLVNYIYTFRYSFFMKIKHDTSISRKDRRKYLNQFNKLNYPSFRQFIAVKGMKKKHFVKHALSYLPFPLYMNLLGLWGKFVNKLIVL
jgi:glycosyltransferase involved in cell wall biosynthesis